MQDFSRPREEMVERLSTTYPDASSIVLEAMSQVPRHVFTERGFWHMAYCDCSLPIGHGQTLSQPATVLRALSALELSPGDVLLEIGSGSGYLAAVASKICRKVYGIERILAMVHSSRKRLGSLSLHGVRIGWGDGSHGWPEHAPFNSILYSACGSSLSKDIPRQLVPGGRVAAPIGEGDEQEFMVWTLDNGELRQGGTLFNCSFVPLVSSGADTLG